MTTKNLSKTVIEGGRCGHYKAEVSARASEERAANRHFLRSIQDDPESWDDRVPPLRRPVQPCFDDKLGPIYSFLDSRVGRSWNKVRSELFQKFDARTTPGRHVLFDHLLKSVCEDPAAPENAPHRRYARYFVDAQGRLCKEKPRFNRYRSGPAFNLSSLGAWLAGRKVGRAGASFFWFESTGPRVATVVEGLSIAYVHADEHGSAIRDPLPEDPSGALVRRVLGLGPRTTFRPARGVGFRQTRRLDSGEERFFRALPERVREAVLAQAPVNW